MIALVLAGCVAPPVTATGQSPNTAVLGSEGGDRAAAAPLLYPAYLVNGANYFGYALGGGDTNGDGLSDLLVGSPFTMNYRGKAEAFFGDPAGPVTPAGWTATGYAGDYVALGEAIVACDIDGDGFAEVAVGEPETGHVRVYAGGPAGPGAETTLTDPDEGGVFFPGDSGDSGGWYFRAYHAFGYALACGDTDGDGFRDLVVGAPYGGDDDNGQVRLYRGSASGVAVTPSWTVEGIADSEWGSSVAWLGDVNGDGYGEVAVGTSEYSTGGAAVFYGGAGGPDTALDWYLDLAPLSLALIGSTSTSIGYTSTGTATGGYDTGGGGWDSGEFPQEPRIGEIVAEAGDVNGDGFTDLLIGAPEDDDDEGVALLYLGSASGLSPTSAWRVEANDEVRLGFNLLGLSDLDGDGYRELGVLAPDVGPADGQGAAYVFRGTATGAETTAAFTLVGPGQDALYWDLVDLGDVDGDGFAEVGFSMIYQSEIQIYTAAAPVGTPEDTGTPPADTGDTSAPPVTNTDGNTDGASTDGSTDAETDKGGGCGCASGGPAGAALLLPLLLVVHRRR